MGVRGVGGVEAEQGIKRYSHVRLTIPECGQHGFLLLTGGMDEIKRDGRPDMNGSRGGRYKLVLCLLQKRRGQEYWHLFSAPSAINKGIGETSRKYAGLEPLHCFKRARRI